MQLFAVACRWPGLDEEHVVEAVRTAAAAFPELDDRTLERGSSDDGRVAFAAIAHPRERAAPRRYFARRGDRAVMYDGVPLPVYDAAELLERWDDGQLEGVFSAVRIDLATARVECSLDVFGMAKLFRTRRGDALVLSNSVDAVRLLTGATEVDPVGAASMLGLGWAAGRRTLLRDIELVEGPVTPAAAVPRGITSAPTAADVAASLTALASTTADLKPLTSGLTAGRDTRVVLALALAAGLDVSYYTSGYPNDPDVVIARELADTFGLRHRLITPEVPDDWIHATTAFSAQTDGLASFAIASDWVEHQGVSGPVGLKLSGAAGGIGRGAMGLAIPLASTTPGLRSSVEAQRRILHRKVSDFGGLVTRDGVALLRGFLDRFIADRLDEGWRPRELGEAYYIFERVRYWASASVRRASVATDLWTPFVSRDFIRYSLSLTPQERAVEAPHWRILGELHPRLREHRFEYPWRPQRPHLASAMVSRDIARKALRRALWRSGAPGEPRPPSFDVEWIEAGLGPLHELSVSFPESPVWQFVDRARLQALLTGPAAPRAAASEGMCRALTVLWWLHGRHEAQAAPGRAPAAPR